MRQAHAFTLFLLHPSARAEEWVAEGRKYSRHHTRAAVFLESAVPVSVRVSVSGSKPSTSIPPTSNFHLQVYHPNIDTEGNICLNILREDWKPVLSVNSVVYGLNFLFLVRCQADGFCSTFAMPPSEVHFHTCETVACELLFASTWLMALHHCAKLHTDITRTL